MEVRAGTCVAAQRALIIDPGGPDLTVVGQRHAVHAARRHLPHRVRSTC